MSAEEELRKRMHKFSFHSFFLQLAPTLGHAKIPAEFHTKFPSPRISYWAHSLSLSGSVLLLSGFCVCFLSESWRGNQVFVLSILGPGRADTVPSFCITAQPSYPLLLQNSYSEGIHTLNLHYFSSWSLFPLIKQAGIFGASATCIVKSG